MIKLNASKLVQLSFQRNIYDLYKINDKISIKKYLFLLNQQLYINSKLKLNTQQIQINQIIYFQTKFGLALKLFLRIKTKLSKKLHQNQFNKIQTSEPLLQIDKQMETYHQKIINFFISLKNLALIAKNSCSQRKYEDPQYYVNQDVKFNGNFGFDSQDIQLKQRKSDQYYRHTINKQTFKYYRQEEMDKHGRFDLRFPEILNSPINDKWYNQLYYAIKFQLFKIFKRHEPLLKKEQNINLVAKQNQIKMTWLGHASVCLSISGKVHILIDPIFEDRIIDYIGQKRIIEPACKIQQLPPIDVVLVSHDHYDHCNLPSLKKIKSRFNNVKYFFGKNSSDLIPHHSRFEYNELSWTHFKKLKINGIDIKITFVPACHWSKRSLNDQNKRLWGGFVIQSCNKKIYFAGDTGKCGLFKQLQEVFGSFDLSLLPIGAYQPNQQLHAQHINPKQAVQIHNIIKSKQSIGIHWGTFPMSHQSPEQVLKDFREASKNIEDGQFNVVKIGGGLKLNLQNTNQQYQLIGLVEEFNK